MRTHALERILGTERVHRRATSHGDFAIPALQETVVQADDGPFLVTKARSGFVQTRRRIDGTIWAGFQECPLGEEGLLLRQLYETLWSVSEKNSWSNRCSSLSLANAQLSTQGFAPVSLVVPPDLLSEACGQALSLGEAEELMAAQGYVTMVDDVQVLVADLPPKSAILTTGISLTGIFARTDDYVAVTLFRVDRAWVLVGA